VIDCPFCSIDDERQRILEERQYVYIIPSNPRLVPHHLLVIPKRHIERPSELEPEERRELFDTVIEFQEKIIALQWAPGCDVRQNCRPFLPQNNIKIDHAHWHLLPRWPEDDLYLRTQIFERDVFTKLSPTEMRQEMEILQSILRAP